MTYRDHRNLDHRNLKIKPVRQPAGASAACAPWAMLLPDAAEGLLTEAEQRALDYHLASCAACAAELAEARRGLAWLTVLKDQAPAPPPDTLANILAQTTGMAEAGVMLPPAIRVHIPVATVDAGTGVGAAEGVRPSLLKWLRGEQDTWSSLLQPRLAMTGATAFFSICLTLNLLGISVSQLDAQGLRKGGLERTVADKRASLVRSFQGLRVVYQVESRVNEMRAGMDDPAEKTPAP